MTMRTCLDCGTPCHGPRCADHDTKGTATQRGYDAAWDRLSRRARRLQPWCTDCGSTERLEGDHSPEAWAAKAAGKPIKLTMIDVVCGRCNIARGAARGPSTRGMTPPSTSSRPLASPDFPLSVRGRPL